MIRMTILFYTINFIAILLINILTVCSNEERFGKIIYGSFGHENYSLYITNDLKVISAFHDVPLYANRSNNIFNFIVEIPRHENHKIEINKYETMNPLQHDMKNGKIRLVQNPYNHNYGAFPQTWENPNVEDNYTNCRGDNDPLDGIEIGSKILERGNVVKVKILGILALIDEGEADWKVITVNIDDPYAKILNDIRDVDKHFPKLLDSVKDWFKFYKKPVINTIGLNETVMDHAFALSIIEGAYKHWNELVMNQSFSSSICRENLMVKGSPFAADSNVITNKICMKNLLIPT